MYTLRYRSTRYAYQITLVGTKMLESNQTFWLDTKVIGFAT